MKIGQIRIVDSSWTLSIVILFSEQGFLVRYYLLTDGVVIVE